MPSPLARFLRRQWFSVARRVRPVRNDWRFRREVLGGRAPLDDLTRYERRFHSQNGEDGILRAIFARIGVTNRYYVEFGVEDGAECNTRWLREHDGWTGLLMDGGHEDAARNLRREFITAENVGALFEKHGVPREPDLLSIDVDGNDYWIWRALAPRWRPRVVVVEYNAGPGPTAALSVPYDPAFRWSGTDYFGASLGAFVRLAREHGYTLVACDSTGINAFFVRDDAADGHFVSRPVEAIWRPARYGVYGLYPHGHPPDPDRRLQPV